MDWSLISGCQPSGPTLLSPANDSSLAWETDLTLSWNPAPEATRYFVTLIGGPGVDINSGWISVAQWHIGQLWPGTYTWSVSAGNDYGSTVSAERSFTIQEVPIRRGDANGDRDVDGIDYTIWLNHFDTVTDNGFRDGDFNLDRSVDGVDYTIWLNNFDY